jgi:hypothetical protein
MDNFDHDAIQPCWNRPFLPRHIPAKLKRQILTMIHAKTDVLDCDGFHHAETNICDFDTFQQS